MGNNQNDVSSVLLRVIDLLRAALSCLDMWTGRGDLLSTAATRQWSGCDWRACMLVSAMSPGEDPNGRHGPCERRLVSFPEDRNPRLLRRTRRFGKAAALIVRHLYHPRSQRDFGRRSPRSCPLDQGTR